ncbi:MAG: alkyl sulfatase C-terminal domain-containing protein, partial [Steroidobacteraceae bacterium]
AVLIGQPGKSIAQPTLAVTAPHALLAAFFLQHVPLETLEARGLKDSGDRAALQALQAAIETPPPDFPIALP